MTRQTERDRIFSVLFLSDEDKAMQIRQAKPSDAAELVHIYAPYVEKTAITFEYAVPTIEEFSQRIQNTCKKYPYIVAVMDGEIVGYAYASTFKNRPAYDWSCELSVYVTEKKRHAGIGTILYDRLEQLLAEHNFLNLYACISVPNPASIEFHKKRGFETIGRFTRCGYKLGTWHDMVWMEKLLNKDIKSPKPLLKSGKEGPWTV